MSDPNEEQIRKQRAQFIKAFEDLATATAHLAEASANQSAITKKQMELVNKQIEVTNGLIEVMMMPKDGMRDVIDEVLEEVRGLRDDLRAVAKAGGLGALMQLLKQSRGG